jgi:hypothetical protein
MQGSVRTHLAALVATLVLAPALGAQEIARPEVARPELARPEPVAATAPTIPSRDAASVAVRAPVAAGRTDAEIAPAAAASLSRGETYMIIGGAALLTGLIIGDDAGTVIAVGGAVVGLYGLYLYLGTQ